MVKMYKQASRGGWLGSTLINFSLRLVLDYYYILTFVADLLARLSIIYHLVAYTTYSTAPNLPRRGGLEV